MDIGGPPRCARHGLMMYRRYSIASGEPTGPLICGACVQENMSSSRTPLPVRPDPTIVTRDTTSLVPAACIMVLGVLLLVAMLRYG